MTSVEILNQAFLQKIVPHHLHGRTQHKTLHARLSEDVSRRLENSRFFRTAPGRFFLNSLKTDPKIPEAYKVVFHAPQRRKELLREKILAVRWPTLVANADVERLSIENIRSCLQHGHYAYMRWRDLVDSVDYTPVHSFVVVHRDEEILSFRCGKFTPQSDPIHGMRSIGFGGAVFATDPDMLYDSFFGIIANAVSELVYGLGLPRRLAEKARYGDLIRPHFGTVLISPKTHLRYLHVVLSYRCPDDFTPTKRALSLNDLRWILANRPTNTIDQFDQTSQFLIEHGYVSDIVTT